MLVLAACGLLNVYPVEDFDVWWLLAGGRLMVEQGVFPMTDPFSATAAGSPWVNHAWGFQLLLYVAYRLGAETGLIALQAAFALGTFALLYRALRREGLGCPWVLVLLALSALATRGFWAPRPQIVTYALFAVFWIILRARPAGRPDRLLWLPPLACLWANLHGGFAIGLALIALVWAGELAERLVRVEPLLPDRRRLVRLPLVLLAATAATVVNPFHVRAILFPLQVMGDQLARTLITEWAPPPFHAPQVLLIEAMLLAVLLLSALSPRPLGWTDLGVLAVFVLFGLQSVRNLPFLVLVLVWVLGRLLVAVRPEWTLGDLVRPAWEARRRLVAAGAVVVALLAAGAPALWRGLHGVAPRLGLTGDVFPVGATDFLDRARLDGNIFNDYGWGGYLIWRLFPRYRVTIDGRAAVYGPRRLAYHVQIEHVQPGWRERLEALPVRLVLVRTQSALALVLRLTPGWDVLYQDHVAVVFGRR